MWALAFNRKGPDGKLWQPTNFSFLCSKHFNKNDFFTHPKNGKTMLNNKANPYDINGKQKINRSRRPVIKKKKEKKKYIPQNNVTHKRLPPSPSKLSMIRKIKTLRQRVRRWKGKAQNLNDVIHQLKSNNLLSNSNAASLENNFSGTCKELFCNELTHLSCKGLYGRRYSEEVKQFALTLHFYSPKDYNFVRKILKLPHPNSIKQWTASVNCEPGFFQEVFFRPSKTNYQKARVD